VGNEGWEDEGFVANEELGCEDIKGIGDVVGIESSVGSGPNSLT
jgi:hypothetical protein